MSSSLGNRWLLNLVNRMCLSNSDPDVQSAGYNSAQSPTNWEWIHGKDPSCILCWLSSRLSIALDDKNQNAKFKIVGWQKKLGALDTQCFETNQRFCYPHNYNFFGTKPHGPCKTAWNMKWSRLISIFVWVSGASGVVTTNGVRSTHI